MTSQDNLNLINSEPLSVIELAIVANDIIIDFKKSRPEFSRLVDLQRNAGTRVNELFQADRWKLVSSSVVRVEPQKGNAMRFLNLQDIGFANAEEYKITLADMRRLPAGQYMRAFAYAVKCRGLWRLYDEGFAHPSTHMLRHLKIKELYQAGNEKEYIANWIGEKKVDNLDYYINSKYFL